jgi:TetR/AcrR family transcriptional regulator of autoinduction and epiphytic fitness
VAKTLSTFSESKRAAILAAAERAFIRHGFAGTSMDMVAELAEVSKRTVYNHFASKDTLFDVLIDQKWQTLAPAASKMPPRELSVDARLRMLAHDRLRVLLNKDVIGLFRIVFAESVASPSLMRAYLGYDQRTDYLGLGTVLAEETARGRLHVEQHQIAAAQFWGMVLGATFWPLAIGLRASPDETELEINVDEAVATFLARFAKKQRRSST